MKKILIIILILCLLVLMVGCDLQEKSDKIIKEKNQIFETNCKIRCSELDYKYAFWEEKAEDGAINHNCYCKNGDDLEYCGKVSLI